MPASLLYPDAKSMTNSTQGPNLYKSAIAERLQDATSTKLLLQSHDDHKIACAPSFVRGQAFYASDRLDIEESPWTEPRSLPYGPSSRLMWLVAVAWLAGTSNDSKQ